LGDSSVVGQIGLRVGWVCAPAGFFFEISEGDNEITNEEWPWWYRDAGEGGVMNDD